MGSVEDGDGLRKIDHRIVILVFSILMVVLFRFFEKKDYKIIRDFQTHYEVNLRQSAIKFKNG